MPLPVSSRSTLYQGLIGVVDDPLAVQDMLSCFPLETAEEPATKDFVSAQVAGLNAALRDDMRALELRLGAKIDGVEAGLDARLTARIDGLDARLTARIDGLDARLTARIDGVDARLSAVEKEVAELRTEMRTGFADVTAKIAELRADILDRRQRRMDWLVATAIAGTGTVAALVGALLG